MLPSLDMATESVEQARAAFRKRHYSRYYSGSLHLAATIGLCLAIALVSASLLDDVTALEWFTVPLTFMYANIVEYAGHRGPMHHRTRFLGMIFKRHSIEHHSFFTDEEASFDSSADFKAVLFPPIMLLFFFGGFALPLGALLYFLLSPNIAYLFVLTAILYYLNYEMLHFAYHMNPQSVVGRLPIINRLRRHHILHHNRQLMTRCNFNITYPICDYFFGTLRTASTSDEQGK